MMDGVAAQSMRDKGLNYRLNWGAPMTRLKIMARDIGHDYNLAIALWKEDVRECRLLATMVMPPDGMPEGVADIWMEQTRTLEEAEAAALNLYQHLPYAADKAYRWIASEEPLRQVAGFHVLSRLFMRGQEPNERGAWEFLDQAVATMKGGHMAAAKAAMQSLYRFADLGLVYERMAKSATKQADLDVF